MDVNLEPHKPFLKRHNGESFLSDLSSEAYLPSIDRLIDETVPADIRLKEPLNITDAQTEHGFLRSFKKIAQKNAVTRNYIGMGYYETITPNVILRNILENPAWYTAYTPYQAEIAQGRLEALINFQTMIVELTGLPISNASLLDEATAAAEAMRMLESCKSPARKNANKFFISETCHPQTIAVTQGRAEPVGIEIVVGKIEDFDFKDESYFGMLVQNPDTNGHAQDLGWLIAEAHENNLKIAVASDLLALVFFVSPGKLGADICVGSTQRFGIPLGFGGPHAAFLSATEEFKRIIPGRIIGISKDAEGNPAYRMALQTREQHIKREKATSNICTSQVLLAVMAGMYAVYHGPFGLHDIACRIYGYAFLTAEYAQKMGFAVASEKFFDTVKILSSKEQQAKIRTEAEKAGINFRYFDDGAVGISYGETIDEEAFTDILAVFENAGFGNVGHKQVTYVDDRKIGIMLNDLEYLKQDVFNRYHTEHEMLRYIKRLENKDLSLVHSMISLGSCTMKLNATAEMMPLSWAEINSIHPFAPENQWLGYREIIDNLSTWLCKITGFDACSLQPNSGAQGEYAGLMVIRAYHNSKGDTNRNIALIPSSAHGTNPASAVMAGMEVVIVKCDEKGNIDVADLKEKAEKHSNNLSCLMVTYPSTHGVFEESIREVCNIIHQNGGRVYMDGANMNAQVGLTGPGYIGADVCHLNLHKTFAIPHGGGGPGMGPICVVNALAPFLPSHPVVKCGGEKGILPISAAPFGSASVLTISYAYISLMGSEGLRKATELAILNANYLKERLYGHFDILYKGAKSHVAHELILDCREFKKYGVEVEDIAKRLMDYGYHAPTVSFPVPGTLMIEPTESESKAELDRFIDAITNIRNEIREIAQGEYDVKNNVLKNAPHTQRVVMSDNWDRPYTREKAAFPLPELRFNKFWPSVSRVDNAHGDRNLICTCAPVEEYQDDK